MAGLTLTGLTLTGLSIGAIGQGTEAAGPMTDDERIELRALADIATLGVSGWGCDGPLRGSGFVVDGVTYTNRHLVVGGDEVKLDQLVAPVVHRVDRIAADLDVATAPGVDAVELEFAAENPAVGTTVVAAGHAGGGATVVSEGVVHLYSDGAPWGIDGTVMAIDTETEPGFSGGPVLDREGRVVAMLQGYEPGLRLTLAVPVEEIRSWSESRERSVSDLSVITEACDLGLASSTGIGGG